MSDNYPELMSGEVKEGLVSKLVSSLSGGY